MTDRYDDRERDRKRCPNGSFSYTIRSGDTLYLLARRYNTTVEAIMRINPGIEPENLQIGQIICIPEREDHKPHCPNGFYYTVRPGDTIYKLSQQFNVRVDEIMRANPRIDPNNLRVGQVLCIPRRMPEPEPELPPCPNGVYYRVKSGDTLYVISQEFNVSLQELISANPGVDPNNLRVGKILCIPKKCVVFCL